MKRIRYFKDILRIPHSSHETFLPLEKSSCAILRTGGILLAGYSDFGEGYRVERTNPGFHLLLYSVEGSGALRYRDLNGERIEQEVGASRLVVAPAHSVYGYRPLVYPWRCAWLHLDPQASAGPPPEYLKGSIPSVHPWESAPKMLSAMTDLVRENGDGGDSAIAELYAKILFLRVESSPPKDEQPDQRRARILIGTLRDKIASGLHKPWSAQLLAEVAGFSTTHLNRLFRTTLGTAPMALVRELRMDRAKELLRRTDYPVAAIAGSVGYADQFAFSAAFKRTVGMNPREYRNSRGRDAAATQRTAAQ